MEEINQKGGLLGIAGRLAQCKCLTELEEICENQKTIKTSVLQEVCERISNELNRESISIRNMAIKIKDPSEWISVDDRLPGNEDLVLIADDDGDLTVGSYRFSEKSWRIGNYNISWDFDFNIDIVVACWMPLPDPPK